MIKDFDAWLRQSMRESACRKLKARRLAERESGGLVLCCKRRDGSVMGALVSPSTDHAGKWRVTWFDERGFSGDGTRNSKFEAIHECLREGYHDTNRNLLRQYSALPSFQEGNEQTHKRLAAGG